MLSDIEEMTVIHGFDVDPARPTEVTGDGWLCYPDDGEVIGRVDDATTNWRPIDEAAVEWSLELLAEFEAGLAAEEIHEKAILANIAKRKKAWKRKIAWWNWRFLSDVVGFARKSLEGGKSRTLQLVNGAIAFRKTSGTNKIVDEEAAVEWMAARDPQKVKVVRSVTATDVLKVSAAQGGGPGDLAGFLYSTPPGESITVSTGIGK